jgi:Fe-Mn family superoxide dismutase
MKQFQEHKWTIGELKGINAKNIEEHLKLYSGYVKNTNGILEKIKEYRGYVAEDSFAPYVINELYRRFSFEYNGMKNHEIYFDSLEGGGKALNNESALYQKIIKDFDSYEKFLEDFKTLALTRGIGWASLWYDKDRDILMTSWIDEQHLGQLNNTTMILGIDMWEHAYVYDYPTSEKKKYIEAFFENLNWSKIENNFTNAVK